MLVFDDNSEPLILDNVYTPTITENIWVLDLGMMDFTLAPLLVLEEIVAPTIEVMILGFKFKLPANWNILIVDDETLQLDVQEVSELPGKEYRALIYGPKETMIEHAVISVTDYFPHEQNVSPSLNKHQMLCHPVSPETWVNVAPSDTYNKYLKNMVAGNLIG